MVGRAVFDPPAVMNAMSTDVRRCSFETCEPLPIKVVRSPGCKFFLCQGACGHPLKVEQLCGCRQVKVQSEDRIAETDHAAWAAPKFLRRDSQQSEVFTLNKTSPAYRWRVPPGLKVL